MKDEYYKIILDALIDLLDEGVYIVDKDGVGLHYNKAMADMEKVNLDDVLGKKFHDAFPDFSIDESTMFKALKKKISIIGKEQTYNNFYGKQITTINSTVPVMVDDEPIAAIEVAKDITSIRQMSDTLLELQETAEGGKQERKSKLGAPGIKRYSFKDIIGDNPEFREVVEKAQKAARNDATVFIHGETGTGKELIAQSIHYEGTRKDKPFLAQNCAAIPESLLEGMLFGTAKGGFTGAVDRAGLFEQANDGTILLDEISAMPYELQSKLLRVLQENYIRRVGGTKDIPIRVRIIATVNEDPRILIEQGKLRRDLYYRLNVVNISIPPLRQRLDDIPVLCQAFLEKHNERFHKEVWMMSDGAIAKLKKYNYPGNVRELENIIEQAVSLAEKEHILTEKNLNMPDEHKALMGVDQRIGGLINQSGEGGSNMDMPLDAYLDHIESQLIKEAIIEEKGNISRAAARLHIKRQTLQHKLKKYHMT